MARLGTGAKLDNLCFEHRNRADSGWSTRSFRTFPLALEELVG